MFDYESTLDVLRDFKHLGNKKRKKVIRALFYDDEFLEWLFNPPKVSNLNEVVTAMYAEFTKEPTMRAIVDVVKEDGYSEFNRSHASFITSIANIAIESNNTMLHKIEKKRKNGELSRGESSRLVHDIDDINDTIASLLKCGRKIVKHEAAVLAREANLPKFITMTALTSTPEPKYIDHYKIGVYLNIMMDVIYSDVERYGQFDENVRWKVFFKNIFGKDNVVEAATFILLEGVKRVDKYKKTDDVKMCWDSLTSFALRALNDAPDQLRQQMIELYIKRIDKMFKNDSFDLRVNLLDINDDIFPKLCDTIDKYSDKIVKILKNK